MEQDSFNFFKLAKQLGTCRNEEEKISCADAIIGKLDAQGMSLPDYIHSILNDKMSNAIEHLKKAHTLYDEDWQTIMERVDAFKKQVPNPVILYNKKLDIYEKDIQHEIIDDVFDTSNFGCHLKVNVYEKDSYGATSYFIKEKGTGNIVACIDLGDKVSELDPITQRFIIGHEKVHLEELHWRIKAELEAYLAKRYIEEHKRKIQLTEVNKYLAEFKKSAEREKLQRSFELTADLSCYCNDPASVMSAINYFGSMIDHGLLGGGSHPKTKSRCAWALGYQTLMHAQLRFNKNKENKYPHSK